MPNAPRERVFQTTKPSISSGNTNIMGRGDMTQGVGSPRKGGRVVHGVTPDATVVTPGSNRHYSAIVDRDNTGLKDSALPKGAQRGRRK